MKKLVLAIAVICTLLSLNSAALADVIFKVTVDWVNDGDPSPEDLELTIYTYTNPGGVGLLDSQVMEYVNTVGDFSYFRVEFTPNSSAVYWGVGVHFDNPVFEVTEGNPAFDNDQIDLNEDNTILIHIEDL